MKKISGFMASILLAILTASTSMAQDLGTAGPLTRSITPRIVGGEEADPGAWPWMAALVDADADSVFYGHECGGALIQSNWILTAGHCVYGLKPYDLEVVVGIHDLKRDAATRIGVEKIILHPDYDDYSLENDIALMQLSKHLTTAIIPLASSSTVIEGKTGVALGWGYTSYYGNMSEILLQASLAIVSNKTCNEAFNAYNNWYYDNPVTEDMVCAGDPLGKRDSCTGDSGGPLIVLDGDIWRLAGVVSWGEKCAEEGLYGVYSRVSAFSTFISENMETSPSPVLHGRVTTTFAGQTGIGVANAQVTLAGTSYEAHTDSDGRFILTPPPGSYLVQISAPGLAAVTAIVTLSSESGVELDRQMTPLPSGDFNENGRLDMGDVVGVLQVLAGFR